MLQYDNYIIINKGKYTGHIVQIKSILSHDLFCVYPAEGDSMEVYSDEIRFVELTWDILSKLKDPEYPGQVATHLKTHEYELHKKVDWVLDLRGKRFYLHGILHGDASIWQFGNLITIHYLHQLQNLVKILNPEIDLTFQ